MTPIERIMFNPQGYANSNWPSFRRVGWFLLVQVLALFVIFWGGIFTLIGAIWQADPNYIGIFLLLVFGFEFLALRIIIRRKLLTILGIIFLLCGAWLHQADSKAYDVRTCQFIQHAKCQEFGDGFMCRQESENFVSERTVSRADISACAALDEF